MKFLDPTNDIVFKKVFGNDQKKSILISFLNSILELPEGRKIHSIEIANPYQVPKLKDLKETILDVNCIDERGIRYIVEMQVVRQEWFAKRILYYTSKAYSNQIDEGQDYPKLNMVIFIGILGFKVFETSAYISNHLILDKETKENYLEDFRFTFIELPKFNKKLDECKNTEDKWIYFLKEAKNLNVIPEQMENEQQEAFLVLDKFGWSKEELDTIDKLSMYRTDERSRIEYAKAEGRAEGMLQEKKNLAAMLKKEGEVAAKIMRLTGLSEEEIQKL